MQLQSNEDYANHYSIPALHGLGLDFENKRLEEILKRNKEDIRGTSGTERSSHRTFPRAEIIENAKTSENNAPEAPSAKAISLAADSLAAKSELLNDYAGYFVLCDSKAQRILLKALIQQAKLKPDGKVLSGVVRLEPQAKILSHKVDFLVNSKLAIDIDRHVYRNAKMTLIRDRMRNQSLVLDGYRPMTFSGNQILADPDGISQTIIATARQLT